MVVNTSKAFIITLFLLFAGFLWTSFFANAPYSTFATTIGLVFGANAGKRLMQKRKEFNGGEHSDE